jgi:hypothetical protein
MRSPAATSGFRTDVQATKTPHLRVSGTHFLKPDGSRFAWRGITAFRLVELVAHGRQTEADAYLKWAASKKLTLVRVFVMADALFKLSPADGVRALPILLDMASRHGLYVEVVALADTARLETNIPAHVRAVWEVCARYGNALLEIANEPAHPTQSRVLHDPAYLQQLARTLSKGVPVSLGSVEANDGYGAGDYVTWHAPRGGDHVRTLQHGTALIRQFAKPVISDEPIGAADRVVPGRRDNSPDRFRAAARATRRSGMEATFHYESGLQAMLPSTTEMACLDAWLKGIEEG